MATPPALTLSTRLERHTTVARFSSIVMLLLAQNLASRSSLISRDLNLVFEGSGADGYSTSHLI